MVSWRGRDRMSVNSESAGHSQWKIEVTEFWPQCEAVRTSDEYCRNSLYKLVISKVLCCLYRSNRATPIARGACMQNTVRKSKWCSLMPEHGTILIKATELA